MIISTYQVLNETQTWQRVLILAALHASPKVTVLIGVWPRFSPIKHVRLWTQLCLQAFLQFGMIESFTSQFPQNPNNIHPCFFTEKKNIFILTLSFCQFLWEDFSLVLSSPLVKCFQILCFKNWADLIQKSAALL